MEAEAGLTKPAEFVEIANQIWKSVSYCSRIQNFENL
jgi:hypothetical protein